MVSPVGIAVSDGLMVVSGGLEGVRLLELTPYFHTPAFQAGLLGISWETFGHAKLQITGHLDAPRWEDWDGSVDLKNLTVTPQARGAAFFRLKEF